MGPTKRDSVGRPIRRLRERFAPHGVLHHGQGQWYRGEPLPRWGYSLFWRRDGLPLWSDTVLFAHEISAHATFEAAVEFSDRLLDALEFGDGACAHPVHEDPMHFMGKEALAPGELSAEDNQLEDPQERARLVRMLGNGLANPVSYVIPVQLAQRGASGRRRCRRATDQWGTPHEKLFLLLGDNRAGYRLPLKPLTKAEELNQNFRDTMLRRRKALAPRRKLRRRKALAPRRRLRRRKALAPRRRLRRGTEHDFETEGYLAAPFFGPGSGPATRLFGAGQSAGPAPARRVRHSRRDPAPGPAQDFDEDAWLPDVDSADDWLVGDYRYWVEGTPIRTAMAVEPRDGALHVFMPPIRCSDEYLDLVEAVEETAAAMNLPVRIESQEPPRDGNFNVIGVTTDPGGIEVNINLATNWQGLRDFNEALNVEARQSGLDSSIWMVDGRLRGSGGGNHIAVGGATAADSPFLRRPDLVGSIIRFWQRHPSLSYLFSGMVIGPTNQAPRSDKRPPDAVYEMEIARGELARVQATGQAMLWLCDRVLRHLLTDLTGNTYRAEICTDKMYSPDGPTGHLSLVEFHGFELPPHGQMSMARSLVMRALLAWVWDKPFTEPPVHWGKDLHDRFNLPHRCRADFNDVLDEFRGPHGFAFRPVWYGAQFEMRFGEIGHTTVGEGKLTLRNGIEPWLVLGEEATGGDTLRYVDSSFERGELEVEGDLSSHRVVTCTQVEVPLQKVGPETCVAGVRFRSCQPWSSLHPTIPAHAPLVFDAYDRGAERSGGGLKHLVTHAGGRADETRPINDLEAGSCRRVGFQKGQQTPFRCDPIKPRMTLWTAATLDLRFI